VEQQAKSLASWDLAGQPRLSKSLQQRAGLFGYLVPHKTAVKRHEKPFE
jgi:hypothetical protein